ncbi:PRTRC genetic system protein F [Herbaspirillum sp. 1173]|uniref:PRTRC system protein F n=1 Tax=Herbaspirillum sp. 1173 TaxID=2817734 RepID=UPI00285CE6A2|nr:PRTRC system protein F [Herbaspirillum sp. 1173]MDR6739612.1 PRTRC genetic system protein F [Herbaspirillum sp. 1173]
MKLDARITPWILPRLSATIPTSIWPAGAGERPIARDLAICLLQTDLVDEADLQSARDETELCKLALTRWWSGHARGLSLFRLQPSIQTTRNIGHYGSLADAAFCLDTEDRFPLLTMESTISHLEEERYGLGQTVLALLYDALAYLPYTLSPDTVFGLAQYYYWQGEADEVAFANVSIEYEESGASSVEQFLSEYEVFRKADFFRNIPDWLVWPKRVCSRKQALRAAETSLTRDVIAACDSVSAWGQRPEFIRRADISACHIDSAVDPICATMALAWSDNDATTRVIDDAFSMFMQGESTEMVTVSELALDVRSVKKRLAAMEEMLGLARRVEELILLIGART